MSCLSTCLPPSLDTVPPRGAPLIDSSGISVEIYIILSYCGQYNLAFDSTNPIKQNGKEPQTSQVLLCGAPDKLTK